MDAIFKRRSIRKYLEKPVSEDILNEIIKAGMAAPSAGDERPWHFIIINNRKLLDDIQKVHPHSQMLKTACASILVCGDLLLERHKGYWIQDCSAATENILIAVADKNLGAVWLGVYPREDRVNGIKRLIRLPDHVVPFSLIPIGYPAEKKEPKDNFDISRIRYNFWE